jgi:hypothetical protein
MTVTMASAYLLSGLKRTCLFASHVSAFDPKRTCCRPLKRRQDSVSLAHYRTAGSVTRVSGEMFQFSVKAQRFFQKGCMTRRRRTTMLGRSCSALGCSRPSRAVALYPSGHE